MNAAPQELLKEYVQSQHFTSTADIMAAMKEMFRDVIQTVMEVEMDEELGRQRCERSDAAEGETRNYRNGYSKKTVKTQLGKVDMSRCQTTARSRVFGRDAVRKQWRICFTNMYVIWKNREKQTTKPSSSTGRSWRAVRDGILLSGGRVWKNS